MKYFNSPSWFISRTQLSVCVCVSSSTPSSRSEAEPRQYSMTSWVQIESQRCEGMNTEISETAAGCRWADVPMLCAHGGSSLCTLYCWGAWSSAETSPLLLCPAISVENKHGFNRHNMCMCVFEQKMLHRLAIIRLNIIWKHEERELHRCDLFESYRLSRADMELFLINITILISVVWAPVIVWGVNVLTDLTYEIVIWRKPYLIRLFTTVGHLFNSHHLICAHILCLENTNLSIPWYSQFTHVCMYLTAHVLLLTFIIYLATSQTSSVSL